MRILVTGPESSGTKLVASLLRQAGADVTHSSPKYRIEQGKDLYDGYGFDATVLVIRNGYTNVLSMVDNGHESNVSMAEWQIADDIYEILESLSSFFNVHVVTYEAIVHEPKAIEVLCETLGLDHTKITDTIGDGNSKWYREDGIGFSDRRELHERD